MGPRSSHKAVNNLSLVGNTPINRQGRQASAEDSGKAFVWDKVSYGEP